MAKKVAPRVLKEPDQFQEFSSRIIRYILNNMRTLSILMGIIVVVLLASGGWYWYASLCEKKAQAMYAKAYDSYRTTTDKDDKAAYANAVSLFEDLIKEYPRTHAATLGYFNMGNLHFRLNEIDKSIEAYTHFLDKSSKKSVLTALAYYGLGYCYEARKEYDKALENYNTSIEHGTGDFYLALNYQNIARIYETMQDHDKAKEYYVKALEITKDPTRERLIKRKLSTLENN